MQFSSNWLKEWVKVKTTTQELADTLTMAGLEVDSITRALPFELVKVAQIKAVMSHPKREHLSVCQLDVGGQSFQVVSAATNLQIDQKVVYALVGAYLPAIHQKGQTLKSADFDGVESQGMLLSWKELGLAEKSEQIIVLSQVAPVGEDVWDYLHLDDDIIEIDLTPNRGDCLSIQGVAREIHALTKSAYNPVKIDTVASVHDDVLPVKIEIAEACPRYCGRVIKQVDCTQSTPEWMVEKLRRSGIRAINPVVDILNFIMIELGQPMHAFDLSKIESEVIVRMSQAGESLKLLDGQDITLNAGTLLITDARQPIAMAGIMGGDDSAVTDNTQDIFLESAFFSPEAIAGKGREYGLHTDSSHRFERGVDPQLQALAIERATQWIIDICGGQPGPLIDQSTNQVPVKQPIRLSLARASELLGFELDLDAIVFDLKRLQCEVEQAGEELIVLPPSFRFDLNIEEDLVEEIARLKGYNNIEAILPDGCVKPQSLSKFSEARLKEVLIDEGYHEVITYSFVDEKLQNDVLGAKSSVALANPIAQDMNVMRRSLWPGLLQAAAYNMHRQQADFGMFEVGLVFNVQGDTLAQEKKIGGITTGALYPEHWGNKPKPLDYFDMKGHIERLWATSGKASEPLQWQPCEHPALHPGQSAQILSQGKVIGLMGALHPSLEKHLDLAGPVFLFELLCEPLQEIKTIQYQRPCAYPAVRRDLSFVVEQSTTCEVIITWLKQHGGANLKDVVLFDVYQGKGVETGHKSLALGLIWQNTQRTLVDTEVDDVVSNIISGLKDTFGAQLRD